jgi:hypothetical protein
LANPSAKRLGRYGVFGGHRRPRETLATRKCAIPRQ